MARTPMPLGTHGKIRAYGWLNDTWTPADEIPKSARAKLGKWRVMTSYRGMNGKTRQVERSGTSIAKATSRLKNDLAKDADKSVKLTATSRFGSVAAEWLKRFEKKVAAGRRSPTTLQLYRSRLSRHVLPAFEHLTITECDTVRFQAFIEACDDQGLAPETQRGLRNICSNIMAVAVRAKAIDHNPVAQIENIEGGSTRASAAMQLDDVAELLAKADADRYSVEADLPDLLRWFFGTGSRVGEALAMTWRYVNLTDKPITRTAWGKTKVIPPNAVWVNATVAAITGQGVVRKIPKEPRSNRIIALPGFLALLLQLRRPPNVDLDEPVFPSKRLGFRWPNDVHRSFQRMRKRLGYESFTTHVGRKTIGTEMDKGGHTVREVANQLGQADIRITEQRYFDREGFNPEAASTIDAMFRGPAA